MMDIADELDELAAELFQPGEELIPRLDSSYEAWEFAVASEWTTLFSAGGFEDQPEFWLHDVGYFNAVKRFYQLKQEYHDLERDIANSAEV